MVIRVGAPDLPEVLSNAGSRRRPDWPHRVREALRDEGVVILRRLLPGRSVARARRRILQELAAANALEVGVPRERAEVAAGVLDGRTEAPSLLRRLDVQALPEVLEVLEHPALFEATAKLLDTEEVVTTAYKWLRAVPPGKYTGPHMDRAYVGAGRRLTAWVPLGSVAAGQDGTGSLCWVPRSHTDVDVVQHFKDYQRAGADGTSSGWLAPDPGALSLPAGCGWRSADFAAGDVAVFGMDLLHTTTPNGTQSFRLSCDTRWQPLHDDPPSVEVGPWRRQAPATAA